MYLKLIFLSFLILALSSFDLPRGWFAAGSKPNSYEMGIDKGAGLDGKSCATIQSKDKKINGFGTLMQGCAPSKYLGERVRMTCLIKTENVEDWTGMWFRIDKGGKSIAFDNMEHRPIKGTNNWKKYEIVLTVSEEATQLAYGVLLSGTGKVWFDDIQFEIVDNQIPTTDRFNSEPQNLSFDE